ncbi:MAG TPA: Ig-like domain repeat protein [Acidimicrobiia bacterium]|nr:Ig-like domain repeat protein [Acidimicrobiia bacterium]
MTITAVGPGAGMPTGTVQFAVDGIDVGDPVTLGGGMATSPPDAGLAVGDRTITAHYSGDPSFTAGTGSVTQTVDPAATTTTVTSSVTPSSFGQPVSFTASVAPVAPGAGTPTGTVQFFVDGSAFGSPVTLASQAAVSDVTSTLSVGLHPVTATYEGTGDFTASTSDALSQDVGQIAATNVVTSTATPSLFGQPVQFVATLTGTQGTPTGSIQFGVDGANLGTPAALTGGVATSTSTSLLTVGDHTVTATYSGDVAYTAGTSMVTQTVNPAGTVTAITATVTPSVFGQPVTYTATVGPVPPGSGTPTGGVEFFADGTSFGTGTLSGGSTVSPPISSLGVGVHTVTGTYTGDPSFVSSTASATQAVGQSGSATTVSSSANPSVSGQAVNFTAHIAPAGNGGGTPDGSVQFLVDGTNFGDQVTLSGGAATSGSTGSLTVGNHTVEADYNPGPSFTTSTATLGGGQTVNKAATSVAVTSGGSSVSGDTVVFTATVGPVAPGAGTPSGSVQFVVDGTGAGDPVALSGGVTTYSTAGLGVGNHDVVGDYSGDGAFQSSTGSLGDGQTVASPAMSDLSVTTQGPAKAVVGLQTSYGIVVTNNGPNDATDVVVGDNIPAGWTVVGAVPTQGTCTIAEGTVSCALGNLAVGTQAAVRLVVVPNGPGSMSSAAAVTAAQGDPNAGNNVSSGTTIVHRFGYWLFGSDGGVFTFGDAQFFGSTGSMHLNKAVVAMTSTPSGQGYWLFASDGGVFAFGDAGFFGSTGNMHLNAPIVAMSSTPTGRGYWLAGADGGVFPFGDAGSFGGLSGHKLAAPIVGMAATPSGHGYWLVASNGGVFPFGDAGDFGSLGSSHVNSPITGIATTADGLGYWLSSTDGEVFSFGDAPFLGSMGGQRLNRPVIGLTSNG